jgi:Ankyrin repeats (3 copies)
MLTLLYSRCADLFYEIIMCLEFKHIIVLSGVCRLFEKLLISKPQRDIWRRLIDRDYSRLLYRPEEIGHLQHYLDLYVVAMCDEANEYLMRVARSGLPYEVKFMMTRVTDHKRGDAFYYAIEYNQLDNARILLQMANPYYWQRYCRPTRSNNYHPFQSAVQQGNLDLLLFVFDVFTSYYRQRKPLGISILMDYCEDNYPDYDYHNNYQYEFNDFEYDRMMSSLVSIAVEHGHIRILDFLFQAGAQFPSHLKLDAIKYTDMFNFLLDRGLPIHTYVINEATKSPPIFSRILGINEDKIRSYIHNDLREIIYYSNLEICRMIEPYSPQWESNHLRVAMYIGNAEVTRYLLDRGIQGEEWYLNDACKEGKLDTIKIYFENGGSASSNSSALYYAAKCGYYELTKYLIDQGLPIKRSAFDYALENRHYDIVALFLDRGYKP